MKLTLIYNCVAEKPCFDTLATSNALYPLAQGLVDRLGVRRNRFNEQY